MAHCCIIHFTGTKFYITRMIILSLSFPRVTNIGFFPDLVADSTSVFFWNLYPGLGHPVVHVYYEYEYFVSRLKLLLNLQLMRLFKVKSSTTYGPLVKKEPKFHSKMKIQRSKRSLDRADNILFLSAAKVKRQDVSTGRKIKQSCQGTTRNFREIIDPLLTDMITSFGTERD